MFVRGETHLAVGFQFLVVNPNLQPIAKLQVKAFQVFERTDAIQAEPTLRVGVVKIGI